MPLSPKYLSASQKEELFDIMVNAGGGKVGYNKKGTLSAYRLRNGDPLFFTGKENPLSYQESLFTKVEDLPKEAGLLGGVQLVQAYEKLVSSLSEGSKLFSEKPSGDVLSAEMDRQGVSLNVDSTTEILNVLLPRYKDSISELKEQPYNHKTRQKMTEGLADDIMSLGITPFSDEHPRLKRTIPSNYLDENGKVSVAALTAIVDSCFNSLDKDKDMSRAFVKRVHQTAAIRNISLSSEASERHDPGFMPRDVTLMLMNAYSSLKKEDRDRALSLIEKISADPIRLDDPRPFSDVFLSLCNKVDNEAVARIERLKLDPEIESRLMSANQAIKKFSSKGPETNELLLNIDDALRIGKAASLLLDPLSYQDADLNLDSLSNLPVALSVKEAPPIPKLNGVDISDVEYCIENIKGSELAPLYAEMLNDILVAFNDGDEENFKAKRQNFIGTVGNDASSLISEHYSKVVDDNSNIEPVYVEVREAIRELEKPREDEPLDVWLTYRLTAEMMKVYPTPKPTAGVELEVSPTKVNDESEEVNPAVEGRDSLGEETENEDAPKPEVESKVEDPVFNDATTELYDALMDVPFKGDDLVLAEEMEWAEVEWKRVVGDGPYNESDFNKAVEHFALPLSNRRAMQTWHMNSIENTEMVPALNDMVELVRSLAEKNDEHGADALSYLERSLKAVMSGGVVNTGIEPDAFGRFVRKMTELSEQEPSVFIPGMAVVERRLSKLEESFESALELEGGHEIKGSWVPQWASLDHWDLSDINNRCAKWEELLSQALDGEQPKLPNDKKDEVAYNSSFPVLNVKQQLRVEKATCRFDRSESHDIQPEVEDDVIQLSRKAV